MKFFHSFKTKAILFLNVYFVWIEKYKPSHHFQKTLCGNQVYVLLHEIKLGIQSLSRDYIPSNL